MSEFTNASFDASGIQKEGTYYADYICVYDLSTGNLLFRTAVQQRITNMDGLGTCNSNLTLQPQAPCNCQCTLRGFAAEWSVLTFEPQTE